VLLVFAAPSGIAFVFFNCVAKTFYRIVSNITVARNIIARVRPEGDLSSTHLLRHLKLLSPEVKVLLSSGHNESEAIRRFAGKGLAGFLQKPYSAIQLAHKVKAALQ
jgi:DNA-binding NtrC family response regulator